MAMASVDDDLHLPVRNERHVASRETNWGVVVTEMRGDKASLAAAETLFRVAGMLIILLGGALPLLTGGLVTYAPVAPVLGIAAACALIGFSLHRYASTGFRSELRIDVRFGWVFLGTVNSDNDFTSKRAIHRRDVESLFIERAKSGSAKLCVQLKDKSRKVVAMVGPEEELIAPLKRTFETLFSEHDLRRRAITRIEGNTVQVAFA